ncbi:MAG: hypothetical protein E5W19_18215 [Mesorhizobium sp.]|nr:MAG: hypothetical protein E5W19_18215 [Mesorhizobium sp.]
MVKKNGGVTSKPIDLHADFASAYTALLAAHQALRAERDCRRRARRQRAGRSQSTGQAAATSAQAEAASAQARLSDTEARIAKLDLLIKKLRREIYGQRSERTWRPIEQLELKELVTSATEDELAAAAAVHRPFRSSEVSTARNLNLLQHIPYISRFDRTVEKKYVRCVRFHRHSCVCLLWRTIHRYDTHSIHNGDLGPKWL